MSTNRKAANGQGSVTQIDTRVSISMPSALRARLENRAVAEDRSLSALVRRVMANYLDEREAA